MEVFIVMTRRFFWQIPECVKFRTVFEDKETILGANDDNEHHLFRKDVGKICFSEREANHPPGDSPRSYTNFLSRRA